MMRRKTGSGVFKVCLTQKYLITIIFRIDGVLQSSSELLPENGRHSLNGRIIIFVYL